MGPLYDRDELKALVARHRFGPQDGSCVSHAELSSGVLIIWIGGRTMGGSAIHLVEEVETLVSAAKGDIIIDLSQCQYLSSLVIGMMVGIAERTRQGRGRFSVASANKQNHNLFTMIGCTEIFALWPTLEVALEQLESGS